MGRGWGGALQVPEKAVRRSWTKLDGWDQAMNKGTNLMHDIDWQSECPEASVSTLPPDLDYLLYSTLTYFPIRCHEIGKNP